MILKSLIIIPQNHHNSTKPSMSSHEYESSDSSESKNDQQDAAEESESSEFEVITWDTVTLFFFVELGECSLEFGRLSFQDLKKKRPWREIGDKLNDLDIQTLNRN